MSKEKGKFITISGLDGSGKSTVLRLLSQHLQDKDVPHNITEEPSKSGNAYQIRKLVKRDTYPPFQDNTILTFVTAARRETIDYLINPSLERGVHVISHRWLADSKAYQDPKLAAELHRLLCYDMMPDLQLILDAPVEVCEERIANRGTSGSLYSSDKASTEDVEWRRHEFTKQLFNKGVSFVDTNRDIKLVMKDVLYMVYKTLGLKL